MPKKNKLQLNDLNVTSFTTSDGVRAKGGGLETNYPCDAPYTDVAYCTHARHLCKPTDVPPIHTEGYEDICKDFRTQMGCMFTDTCL